MSSIRERQLLEEVIIRYMHFEGISRWSAARKAKREMKSAISMAKSTGRYGAGPLGTYFLSSSAHAAHIDFLRLEYHVSDADFCEWWNLDEVERTLVELDDLKALHGIQTHLYNEVLSRERAMQVSIQIFPSYYYYPDKLELADSFLLPVEVKPKVLRYIERTGLFIDQIDTSGYDTFNDWVRASAKSGILY